MNTNLNNKIATMNTNLNNKIDLISNKKIWVHRVCCSGTCSESLSFNDLHDFYISPFNIYSTDSEPINTEEKIIAYLKSIEYPEHKDIGISVTGFTSSNKAGEPRLNIYEMYIESIDRKYYLCIKASTGSTHKQYFTKSVTIIDKVMSLL